MADENVPEESGGKSTPPNYSLLIQYALVGFGVGVALIIMAPIWGAPGFTSLSDLWAGLRSGLRALNTHSTCEGYIIGILFLIAVQFGRPGGVVLCILFLALGVWAYWKWRAQKADTPPGAHPNSDSRT
jgi:hypothetical protein